MLRSYLKRIFDVAKQGDATEVSYYSALEALLKEYTNSVGRRNVHITTLPKKTEAGNPDFRVWDGSQQITGYIEAKSPQTTDLDVIEEIEQLTRYTQTFPNLILTNFLEFRLYRDGNMVEKVSIARPFVLHQLKKRPPAEKEADFLNLLERFFAYSFPRVYDSKKLAVELAKRTRFLRDEVVAQQLVEEEQSGKHFIYGFYKAFKRYLIGGLSTQDFADLYSQTVTYGLFAARTRSGTEFNRKLAYARIPPTIGILRDVFRFISLEDLPQQMEWILDDISEVLAVTDVKEILHRFFHEGRGKDPIVHFYETFLAEYDPATRERRGVYYTPEAVVSYIVRSLDFLLKQEFGLRDGFAADSVTVLDPAAGTLTFSAEAARKAVDEFVATYGEGGRGDFIKEHILKNYYAFELMMAPYAIGHLKISFLLEELGYKLQEEDRFKLYLTNTLEMEELGQTELPGMASLSQESHLAGEVKKQTPILVVLGNPPYSGISANASQRERLIKKGQNYTAGYEIRKGKGRPYSELTPLTKKASRDLRRKQKTWIGELIEHYKIVDGQWLQEKNPKWLQDDYVKFIRFAQWKIEQAAKGTIGFITNHAYLDNPTFRGMRQSLMRSFDKIYVLNLHGSSARKEKGPAGSGDGNVFDIRQGVAISFFLKQDSVKSKATRPEETTCEVYHSEIWGLPKDKHRWLQDNDLPSTQWQKLAPSSPYYFFVPRDEKLLNAYEEHPKLTDIFLISSVGIVTARDRLAIRWTPEEVWSTVLHFTKVDSQTARAAYKLGRDVKDWKVELAQEDLRESGPTRERIAPILYRPFDVRYTYYTGKSRGFLCRPRPQVMSHMFHKNLGLVLPRRVETEIPWRHVLCTDKIVEHVAVSLKTIDYLFPLYLYPHREGENSTTDQTQLPRGEANISPKFLMTLREAYGEKTTSEEVFHYIYAVLHSMAYREKYSELLRMDFPRIPFTRDYDLFREVQGLGRHLADLHLLRSGDLDPPVARFQGTGEKRIGRPRYDPKVNKVYINAERYFEGIADDVWSYCIGGYQVCDKWLKYRKNRELSNAEIKHYCSVITAIQKTIETQRSIDDLYPEIERETIQSSLCQKAPTQH